MSLAWPFLVTVLLFGVWKFPVSGLVHWKFGGNLFDALEISTHLLLHQSLLCYIVFFATLVVWSIGNFPSLVFGTLHGYTGNF